MKKDGTHKSVKVFAWASFLNDMGADMIYPIWPLFVTSFLGANMVILGLIDGIGEAIVSISQALSGYFSDRLRKRKVFIWSGYFFGFLSRIGYAFSSIWLHLIPFRILDRAGKIRDAPRDAIVADVSNIQNRGASFGFLRAMDNLGAVAGILVTIFFFKFLGYKKLFLLAAIPSVIAVILILFFIKERKLKHLRLYKGFSFKDVDNNFKLFLFLSALFALGAFSYSFLLIYAKEFGFQITSIPILYLLFTAIAALFSIYFGRLADRIGRKKVMAISFLFWIFVCLTFLFGQNGWFVVIAFVLYGMHKAAFGPVQKTFISELAPKNYRATVLGGFQMVIGLCALPASFTAGLLWTKWSMFASLYFSLILAVLSLILLMFVKEKLTA